MQVLRRTSWGCAILCVALVGRMGFTQNVPKMVLDAMEKNAGTVWKGQPVKYDFVVKNTGGADLILDVKPGCGCTTKEFDKSIPPGKEGHIILTLSTDVYKGKVEKAATVYSNDPDKKETIVRIIATVLAQVEVIPEHTSYFRIYKGEGRSFSYSISSNDPEFPDLEIKNVKTTSPFLTTKLTPVENEGARKRSYRLDATLSPDTPPGNFSANIIIETNHPKTPTLSILVPGRIQNEITLTSEIVQFFGLKPGVKAEKVVTASKRNGSFKITGYKVDNDHITVDTETLSEGKSYRLRIKYDGGWPVGTTSGKIFISTDDPEQPQLVITYHGNIQVQQPAEEK